MHFFLIFLAYGKNGLRWPQLGPGGFFPTNPDLADILGRTDLNFEKFYFFDFLDPKFPDAAAASAAAADRRTLLSQPDPSRNAPRDQIRRKGPCCDQCAGSRKALRPEPAANKCCVIYGTQQKRMHHCLYFLFDSWIVLDSNFLDSR